MLKAGKRGALALIGVASSLLAPGCASFMMQESFESDDGYYRYANYGGCPAPRGGRTELAWTPNMQSPAACCGQAASGKCAPVNFMPKGGNKDSSNPPTAPLVSAEQKPVVVTEEKQANTTPNVTTAASTETPTSATTPATTVAPAPSSSPRKASSRIARKKQGKPSRSLASTATAPGSYRVKRGDTLMKIAYNTYGDLYRWRDIYAKNKDKIGKFTTLAPGTELTIDGTEYVVIEKNGEPYLIRKKDTLIKISGKLYGTPRKWKSLWENNRQLIRNPNRIYSGFTLYYQPENKLGQTPPPRLTDNTTHPSTVATVDTASAVREPASGPSTAPPSVPSPTGGETEGQWH